MATVSWRFSRQIAEASRARLIVCAVNVIGQKFSHEVTSDIRYIYNFSYRGDSML